MNTRQVEFTGLGYHVPTDVLDNKALGKRLGVNPDWIYEKTGIRERRIAAPHEYTSTLAVKAGDCALRAANVRAADLDAVVVTTSTPDWIQPATACVVQAELGAVHAAAFDISAVCAGAIYSVGFVEAAMRGNPSLNKVLVIGAETYSRVLDYTDPKTSILFGDGAGAVLMERSAGQAGILTSALHADGTKFDLVKIPAGGSRRPASMETVAAREHYFRMQGREVRAFVHKVFPELIQELTVKSGVSLSDIDMLISHQANGVILESLRQSLGLSPNRTFLTIERYGNTGAASVLITLSEAVAAGRVSLGMNVMLVAFGGGMTWGGAALRWGQGRALPESKVILEVLEEVA